MENWETNILTIIKHRATEDIQRDKNISLEQFRIQVLDPSIKEILAIDE